MNMWNDICTTILWQLFDNFLSHTRTIILFSLFLFLSPLFLTNEKREKRSFHTMIFEQPFVTKVVPNCFWQLLFSLFSLVKNNGERKRKRKNNIIVWVWERKLSKSCHKVVVQISLLYIQARIRWPPHLVAWCYTWSNLLHHLKRYHMSHTWMQHMTMPLASP